MKVEIKKEIAEKLQARVDKDEEFKDVEAYVNDILRQVVERLESEYSDEDEAKVKERLRKLGYID